MDYSKFNFIQIECLPTTVLLLKQVFIHLNLNNVYLTPYFMATHEEIFYVLKHHWRWRSFVKMGTYINKTFKFRRKVDSLIYFASKNKSLEIKRTSVKRQPHEGENLGKRIVMIPCKRVYGATQARPCETRGCSRQRCALKVTNKMRLFCSHEQLRYPAKKLSLLSLADAVDVDDFGGTYHLSRMDRKTFAVHRESAQFVTRWRFSRSIRPRVADP